MAVIKTVDVAADMVLAGLRGGIFIVIGLGVTFVSIRVELNAVGCISCLVRSNLPM
jgi:hypothetical protein